jgi:hypothetical protein
MGRNYLYTSQGVISWRFDGQFAVLGDAGGTRGARLNRQRASSIGIRSNPRPGKNPAVLVVYTHLRHQSLAGTAVVGQHSAGQVKLVPRDFSDVSNPTPRTNSFRKSHWIMPPQKVPPSNCSPNLSPDLLRDYPGFGSLLHLIEPCGRLNRCRR